MKADLVIANIGQIVTCASRGKPKRGVEMRDVGLIEDGGVAFLAGKIAAVGKSDDISRAWQSDDIVDADGKIVCPGFVDPHTHIVYAGDRLEEFELKIKGADYLEILAAGGGILSTVAKTRSASVRELVGGGLKRLDKMLECGTTTCEVKTGYGLDYENEMKMLSAIEELDKLHPIDLVPTFLAAHAIPPEFSGRSDEYLNQICRSWLLHLWNWWSVSNFFGKAGCFVDIYCEKGAFRPDQMIRLIEATAELSGFLGFKAHVDQFNNLGGSRIAINAGATSIDHLDTISDEEIKLLAASETIGVVIPTENFNGGKLRFSPARKMIDAGCAIAISTDYNPGSAPCPSQSMAMAIACRYQKLLPAEAMNATTINAAFAIGLGEIVGSIEVGKTADLLLLDTDDYRQVAYEFGTSLVSSVYKNGELLRF